MNTYTPEAITAVQELNRLAGMLGTLGEKLVEVERDIEATEREYRAVIEAYEVGLYEQVQDGTLSRLPSADMRVKLARKAMDPELLGRYEGLALARRRLQDRISNIKAQASSQRSIVSAMKEGLV